MLDAIRQQIVIAAYITNTGNLCATSGEKRFTGSNSGQFCISRHIHYSFNVTSIMKSAYQIMQYKIFSNFMDVVPGD